jgi:hypothetical protein
MVASTLYGYLRNYDVSDTVGFTLPICEGNHDEGWMIISN